MITKEQIYDAVCKIISDYAYAFRINADGTASIEWASESVFRVTGYTMEDLQEDPHLLVGSEHEADWNEATRRLLSGETIEKEARARKKNGESVLVWYHAQPILDEAKGTIIGVVGAARDITKERLYDAARRLSENQLREIADNATSIIYSKDLSGRYTFVNSAFLQVSKRTPDQILGRTDAQIFDAGQADRYRKNDGDAIERGAPIDTEEVFRVNDTVHHYLSTKFPLRDSGGRIYAVCGISTDVTGLKHAEDELRRRDHDIRQAYAEVIAAVTGNRFILMNIDEIEGILGEPLTDRFGLSSFSQLAEARQFVRGAISNEGLAPEKSQPFIMGVGEALTNAIKHGGEGACQVFRDEQTIRVVVSDRGPGIDFRNLPRATLLSGFSTAGTLGVGFTVMLDAADRMLLATEPGSTIVVLELQIGRRARRLAPRRWP